MEGLSNCYFHLNVNAAMNFLAHIYLSGDDHDVLLGNFMGDAIKGKQYKHYRPGIRRGILLHRFIDHFTDTHAVVAASKKRLHPHIHKYAGVAVDVFYDHFLARNWPEWSEVPLEEYVADRYKILKTRQHELPERTAFMLRYMIRDNWLLQYQKPEGIERTLRGLSRRTSFPSGMETATQQLRLHYHAFQNEFNSFFPVLVKRSREKQVELRS